MTKSKVYLRMFYWRSLGPKGGGEAPAVLKQKIEASFGALDACKKELAAAAMVLASFVLNEIWEMTLLPPITFLFAWWWAGRGTTKGALG